MVKVQRPGIAAVIEADLDILRRLARLAERRTAWGASLGVRGLVDGFAAALREELDFRTELESTIAVAASTGARGGAQLVHIPRAFPAVSSTRVLVVERLYGLPVLDAVGRPDAAGLASALFRAMVLQILDGGVFHADPHPGNVFLLDEPVGGAALGLLDFGSVGRLDTLERRSLALALLALGDADRVGLTDSLLEILDPPDGLDRRHLERDLGQFLMRNAVPGIPLRPRAVVELTGILTTYGIGVPAQVAAVLRAIGTLAGTLTALNPGFDLIAEARAVIGDLLVSRLSLEGIDVGTVLGRAARVLPALARLRQDVGRFGAALESASMTLRLDRRTVPVGDPSDLGTKLVTAAAAGATGVTGALLVGLPGHVRDAAAMLTVPELVGYPLLIVSGVLGLRAILATYRR